MECRRKVHAPKSDKVMKDKIKHPFLLTFTLKFVPLQAKMCSFETFIIDLKGLNEGKNHLVFDLGSDYFSSIENAEVTGTNVHVEVEAIRNASRVKLVFDIEGQVKYACDRCLEDIGQAVALHDEVLLYLERLEEGDADGAIDVESGEKFDASWYVYETIALAIPVKRQHAPGECNARMEQVIAEYMGQGSGEDESTETQTDPRWNELLKLRK